LHVLSAKRSLSSFLSLEELDSLPDSVTPLDQRIDLDRLAGWIEQLKPLDRQVIISYLEDMDAVSIGEITGLSPAAVAMRIHRIKHLLARKFRQGGSDAA